MKSRNLAGSVYLIGPLEGCHKIGESASASKRLCSFAVPVELRMVVEIKTDNRTWLERYLHVAFAHRHARGEWFRLTKKDIALIVSIAAASSVEDIPQAVRAMHEKNRNRRGKVPGGRGRPRIVPGKVPADVRWHSIFITDEERAACNQLLAQMRRR